ncbi:MAG: ATPase [Bacilli bacterium]|nr:ATPase [Bacilli bacterium]
MKKYLGLELGSTRIKGVLINESHGIIASGSFTWESDFINGIWTYSLPLAIKGLQTCYKELKEDYQRRFNEKLTHIDSIGISGMMHGYLVFDKDDNQIQEFRTWKNTITEKASVLLTKEFNFQVPQRWSISHIYQAILNKENSVKDIHFATTLCGYIHYLLTGGKVIGIGEASGMFPINEKYLTYDSVMINKFNKLVKDNVPWKIEHIFPKVLVAGQNAGKLTKEGSLLLDPEGDLEVGIPFCPPEGDMGTGMICTNSVGIGTGNSSIGTSSNVTIVTGKDIGLYKEIDVIMTPSGVNAALVHVNNGTGEINAWEKLFKEVINKFNSSVNDVDVYEMMFNAAMEGNKSVKGIYPVDYSTGESITNVNEGKLLLIREPDSEMSLANFVRSHIYSLLGTIRLGVDILKEKEGVQVNKVVGHGGFFKTPMVGNVMLSSALACPIITLPSAGEGGPYGEALLAAYLLEKEDNESLEDYLNNKVFKTQESKSYMATNEDIEGFNVFMNKYKKALNVEKSAIKEFGVMQGDK